MSTPINQSYFYKPAFFLLALLAVYLPLQAQVTLSGTSYTQNFDAMGASGTTAPTGWTTRTAASASSRGTASGALSTNTVTSTSGAFNNFPNNTGRCLGVRQTGTFADPGAAFELEIANTTGKTSFSFSLDHVMLSAQPRVTNWTVQYSTNGTSWTTLGTYTDPGTAGTTPATYSLGTGLDNKSASVYIRVVALSASTSSGNRDSYGVDNISLTWTNASSCTAPATASAANITANSADVSWATASGATSYEYQVSTSATAPASGASAATTSVSVSSLSAATKYYIHVRTACAGSTFSSWKTDSFTTSAGATPDILLAGTSLDFGPNVSGTVSTEKSYSVSGSNLSANISVTAPAGFSISLTSGSNYGSSLTLVQSGGTVNSTTIYVIYSPAAATGAVSANITHTSSGATTESVSLAATAIATEPATAGTISFSAIAYTSITVNFSGGDGAKRIVVMRPATAVNYTPADGTTVSGVNSVFTSATDQGNGNRIVYDGTGTSVSVTGLTLNTTYHVAVYEYNIGTGTSQNYKTTAPAMASSATLEEAIYLTGTNATAYSENFNTIGTSGTASFPAGFQVSAATASPVYGSSVTTAATLTYGSTGTGVVNGTSSGGFVNWANGFAGSSTDRSLGFLGTGTYTGPRSLMVKARNATGNSMTSAVVAYDIEKIRSGSRAMNVKFYYSLNGSSWTLMKTTAYAADAANTVISNPPLSGSEEVVISGLNVATDAALYLRWEFEPLGGASTNSQGLGIDNITITPFSVTRSTGGSLANGSYDNLNIIDAAALDGDVTISGRLRFSEDSKLTLNGHKLTMNGTISGSVLIEGDDEASLTISGTGTLPELLFDQSTPGSSNRIKDLEIDRSGASITVGNTLEVTGTVYPESGTLLGNGNLVLISDAAGTARIAEIKATADIMGNITVQRYVPAVTRRSRTLSSPVSNFKFNQYIDDMYLSGTGGATNGFDSSSANGNSIFTYQETASGTGRGWKNITHIDNTLAAGLGALVFVRGDRTIGSQWYASPFPAQNEVTIDYTSQPVNKGTIAPSITYTSTGAAADDGWNLVGNPYPSPIDWTLLAKQNLGSFYYTYDPATGSYVADDGQELIASGQAFFVQALAGSPSVTFTESAKASGTPVSYFKTQPVRIGVNMVRDNLNADKAWLLPDQQASRSYVPSEDALKFTNALINLAFVADSTTILQVSRAPLSAGIDTFPMHVTAPAGAYAMKFTGIASLASGRYIYLLDRTSGTLTDLRLHDSVSIVIAAANHDPHRFSIIISSNAQALPVKLVSFTGGRTEHETHLKWTVAQEKNIRFYAVQYSPDGITFVDLGKVGAKNNALGQHYFYADVARPELAYYRLVIGEYNGAVSYSAVIAIDKSIVAIANTKVYPNPVKRGDHARLAYTVVATTDLSVTVVNVMGKKVWETSRLAQLQGEYELQLPALAPGLYYLIVKTDSEEKILKVVAGD